MSEAPRTPGWVCIPDNGDPPDHDWQYVSDWGGDPGVINGTFDASFKRCRQCGEEAPLGPNENPWDNETDWDDPR